MASKMQKLYGEIEDHALKIQHLNDKIAFLSSECEDFEDQASVGMPASGVLVERTPAGLLLATLPFSRGPASHASTCPGAQHTTHCHYPRQ